MFSCMAVAISRLLGAVSSSGQVLSMEKFLGWSCEFRITLSVARILATDKEIRKSWNISLRHNFSAFRLPKSKLRGTIYIWFPSDLGNSQKIPIQFSMNVACSEGEGSWPDARSPGVIRRHGADVGSRRNVLWGAGDRERPNRSLALWKSNRVNVLSKSNKVFSSQFL